MIKHKLDFNERWLTTAVPEYMYRCNKAVYPCGTKGVHWWKNVTCKNCLKLREDKANV